jgi:hypothetical protein
MIEVNTEKILVGDCQELYYNTSYKETVCSLKKYKKIIIDGREFFLDGLLWENVGKDDETTYYKYS